MYDGIPDDIIAKRRCLASYYYVIHRYLFVEDPDNQTTAGHQDSDRLYLIGLSARPTVSPMDLLFYIRLLSQIDACKGEK